MSAAQSAASSPPTPWRTSTITSLRSAGSVSTSARRSSSSRLARRSSSSGTSSRRSPSPRAASRSSLVERHSCASLYGPSSSFRRRPASAASRWSLYTDGSLIRSCVSRWERSSSSTRSSKPAISGRVVTVADPATAAPEEALPHAVEPPAPGALALLRRPGFRRVYLAVVTSQLGDAFQYIALMWAALLAGGPLGVLVVRLADSAPALVFGFHGGLVADRADRKRL